MLTPEDYERIDTLIRQKIRIVNFCYDEQLKQRKDRSFKGDVVVNIKISTAGRAEVVDVKESSLGSAEVERCVVELIKSWEFGAMNAEAWLPYTFHFEPQY